MNKPLFLLYALIFTNFGFLKSNACPRPRAYYLTLRLRPGVKRSIEGGKEICMHIICSNLTFLCRPPPSPCPTTSQKGSICHSRLAVSPTHTNIIGRATKVNHLSGFITDTISIHNKLRILCSIFRMTFRMT